MALEMGGSFGINTYNARHGLARLLVEGTDLAGLKPDLTDIHYDMLQQWQPAELGRTELDREAFMSLVFIEMEERKDQESKIRHLCRDGRSLSDVADYVEKNWVLADLFATSPWLSSVGRIYQTLDHTQITLLLKPSDGESEQAAGSWYLEDGNHRALALALRLQLDPAFVFQPVPAMLIFRQQDLLDLRVT